MISLECEMVIKKEAYRKLVCCDLHIAGDFVNINSTLACNIKKTALRDDEATKCYDEKHGCEKATAKS